MAFFNLWSPVLLQKRIICFDVTPGNIPQLECGSREWITDAMKCLEITCEPQAWIVTPWRCHYYSDYPQYENWEDRWRVGWTVRVNVKNDISLPNPPFGTPVDFNQLDSSWQGDSDAEKQNGRALFLAYRTNDEKARLESNLAELTGLKDLGPGLVLEWVEERPVFDGWRGFRATVTGEIFPSHVKELDSVVSLMKAQGWIVDWQSFFFKTERY